MTQIKLLLRIAVAYLIGSCIAGLVHSYVWAYHLAPRDPKSPTAWSVFTLGIGTHIAIATVSTAVFTAVQLRFPLVFARQNVSFRQSASACIPGVIVQTVVILSARPGHDANPLFLAVVALPVAAGLVFGAIHSRGRNPVDLDPGSGASEPSEHR